MDKDTEHILSEQHYPMIAGLAEAHVPTLPAEIAPDIYRQICERNWDCLSLEPYRADLAKMWVRCFPDMRTDYMAIGVTFPVVSGRFIQIMQRHQVTFEAFPLPVEDPRSGLFTHGEFFFLNNLDSGDILNHKKTICAQRRRELYFDPNKFADSPIMFRDKNHPYLVFLHECIAKEIERAGLRGFELKRCEGLVKIY